MTAPGRPSRVDEAIGDRTGDALQVVMAHEGVTIGEALRRLISYGELVYRTVRLERGEVLVQNGARSPQSAVVFDDAGEPILREARSLVWMRPTWSKVACGFMGAEIDAGLSSLEPIARCDRWRVSDLARDNEAERCPACRRAAERWAPR